MCVTLEFWKPENFKSGGSWVQGMCAFWKSGGSWETERVLQVWKLTRVCTHAALGSGGS